MAPGGVRDLGPVTAAHDQGDDDQRTRAEAQRLDVRLQVGDLVLETAHRAPPCMPLRMVQKPEREIRIGIVDDPDWEPDEEFKVQLLDADTEEQLEGDDTECVVLILDEDQPGVIGFQETVLEVSRKDKIAYVVIQRVGGSDGFTCCTANTTNNLEELPGKKAG